MPETNSVIPLLTKPQPTSKGVIELPYHFTEKEMAEMGRKLGSTLQSISEIKNRKKSAQSEFDSKIKALEALCEKDRNLISSGQEYRQTECLITFLPKERRKRYWPLDSTPGPEDVPLKEEDMMPSDFQLHFPEPKTDMEAALNKAADEKVKKFPPPVSADPIEEAIADAAVERAETAKVKERAFGEPE